MIEVTYKSGDKKEYKTLNDIIRGEDLKISDDSLSLALRNANYYGRVAELLFTSDVLYIKWTNRFNEIYEYDVKKTVPEEYRDMIDWTK